MDNNINRAKLSDTYCTDDKTKKSCDVFIDRCATQHEQICMENNNAKECIEHGVEGTFTLELSVGKNVELKSSRMCYIMSPRLAKFYKPEIKEKNSDTIDINEINPKKQNPLNQKKKEEVATQKNASPKKVVANKKQSKKNVKSGSLKLAFKSKAPVPRNSRIEIYKMLKKAGYSGKATIRSYSHTKDNVTYVYFKITIANGGERTTIESSSVKLKPGSKKLSEKQWDKVLGEIRDALDGTTEEGIMDESFFEDF